MANLVSPNQIQIQIELVLLVRPDTRDDTSQPWISPCKLHLVDTMETSWILALLCLFLGLVSSFVRYQPKRRPPGPWFRIPFIGNAYLFLGNPLKNFSDMRKRCNSCHLHLVASARSWYFVFFLKFRLPFGLHSSSCISPTANGTFQKCFTKYYDWPDATHWTLTCL